MADIATAFPGLFSYEQLLDLDARDFAWWRRKAKVQLARDRLRELANLRLSMYGDESFERQVGDLVDQIEALELRPKSDEEIMANWRAAKDGLAGLAAKMKAPRKRARK